MTTRIVVFPRFDQIWPVSGDRLRELLQTFDTVELIRATDGPPAGNSAVTRLFWLGANVTADQLEGYPALRTVFASEGYELGGGRAGKDDALAAYLATRGIERIWQPSEGFWGQSVSEFALGLTIAGLRQLPLRATRALNGPGEAWEYEAEQLSDDTRFASGTVAGKRIRIIGAGNIASRYASYVSHLGADTAAWDPYAPEPAFHRSGARRELHLAKLVNDADIFVPMVPWTPSTVGLVTADLIDRLPVGALVVLVTRAQICDMEAVRRRVIAGELSLAADVFDIEPLPADDPLLAADNVVVTPHIAGRTLDSGYSWALALAEQLPEFDARTVVAPARIRR